jgi:hypothetical protein
MTVTKLQRTLSRIVRDLDAVSGELMDRCLETEDRRISRAEAEVGQVCIALLDPEQLKTLDSISSVYRRLPYSTSDENYITVYDRADVDGKAAERLCERMFSIKKPQKRAKVVPIKAQKRKQTA